MTELTQPPTTQFVEVPPESDPLLLEQVGLIIASRRIVKVPTRENVSDYFELQGSEGTHFACVSSRNTVLAAAHVLLASSHINISALGSRYEYYLSSQNEATPSTLLNAEKHKQNLVEFIAAIAVQKGYPHIRATAWGSQENAFYRGIGFVPMARKDSHSGQILQLPQVAEELKPHTPTWNP